MKKNLIIFLLVICSTVFALTPPKITEDEGMSKTERITELEKKVIELYQEVMTLRKDVDALKSIKAK